MKHCEELWSIYIIQLYEWQRLCVDSRIVQTKSLLGHLANWWCT